MQVARKSASPASIIEGVPETYPALLADLKQRIGEARIRASLAVNRELVLLYWSIGRDILARQQSEGWRTKVIDSIVQQVAAQLPWGHLMLLLDAVKAPIEREWYAEPPSSTARAAT